MIKKEIEELKKLTLLGAKNALTMDDVAALTGLSKSHIYKMVCAKKIPYYKSGGGKINYFKKQDVENWCFAHRVATNEEAEQQAIKHCVTNKKKGGQNV